MTVESVGALRVTRVIAADRQAVWDAWTDPEQMKRWACPAPGGMADATVDLRVGGGFTMRMVVEDNEYNAFGTYREVEAPRRLTYTWDWREEEHRVGDTVVTVEFNEVEGGTEVVLLHEGFPAEEAKMGHSEGWTACFAHLEAHLA